MTIKKILSSVGVGAGAIVIGLGLQYALADWSAAPPNPPTSNVAAPINVGSATQIKNGLLGVVSLVTNTLTVGAGASTTANTVLTNDGHGNASWQAAAGGSSGVTSIIAGNNITVSPSNGTGAVTVGETGPSSGTVGGGCWVVSEGNVTNGISAYTVSPWGNASGNGYSSHPQCKCPSGYTSQNISPANDVYLCLKN